MIQRIQTIWLALAGIAGAMMYKLPLWQYSLTNQANKTTFFASENLLLFLLIVATALIAFVTIFLFRNRPLQKSLTLLGLLLSIGILAIEVFLVEDMQKQLSPEKNSWQIGALLPVAMIILFILARAGVSRDEKMIRSLERLR